MMKIKSRKVCGWLFIALGVLTAECSEQIVFPGLEHLLGIEMIVGRENVVYQTDGSYIFTNPGAMGWWVASVTWLGVLLALAGAFILFQARRQHSISDERVTDNAA
jgi:hypothetical protein